MVIRRGLRKKLGYFLAALILVSWSMAFLTGPSQSRTATIPALSAASSEWVVPFEKATSEWTMAVLTDFIAVILIFLSFASRPASVVRTCTELSINSFQRNTFYAVHRCSAP